MKRTLVFDTETTGLIENSLIREQHQPRIIEFFGNVVNEKGDIVEELEFLCCPGISLPTIITKITGLTDHDLMGEKPFSHYADKIVNLIWSCDSIVAHNLTYDHGMIEFEMKRCGTEITWPPTQICTVEETEWYKGHRLKLADLYEHLFEEKFVNAHRARNDVAALTRCFNELRERGDI